MKASLVNRGHRVTLETNCVTYSIQRMLPPRSDLGFLKGLINPREIHCFSSFNFEKIQTKLPVFCTGKSSERRALSCAVGIELWQLFRKAIWH
jgi:hypothetical protein